MTTSNGDTAAEGPPGQNLIISAALTSSEERDFAPTVRMRTYFSRDHLQAAAHFVHLAASIESAHSSHEVFIEHRAYVTASLLLAIAFLDAVVNELFVDAVEAHNHYLLPLDPQAVTSLAGKWKSVCRQPTINRFDTLLTVTRRRHLKRGQEPCQSVHALMELRNSLIHYKPEWSHSGPSKVYDVQTSVELEQKLKGRFPLHPRFSGSENLFFPDKCLSTACARWAVQASLSFTDEIFATLGGPAPYEPVRARVVNLL